MGFIIVLFAILLSLMSLGFPVFVCIGFSTMLHYWLTTERTLLIFSQVLNNAIGSYTYIAVPFFMLAGAIMTKVGITERLINLANIFVGNLKGGLAQVNILGSMIFAGISGSSTADIAAIGGIMMPAMEKEGYEKGFAGAVTAASSIIGPVIPPSIVLVIYGAAFGVSIGALFAAALIPGLLMGISQMIITYVISIRRGYPVHGGVTLKEALFHIKEAVIPLIMPLIIIGGIFSGQFTATEASAIAVFYGLIVGFFVYRTLSISDLYPLIVNTALAASGMIILFGVAMKFSWIISRRRIPLIVLDALLGLTDDRIILLFIINLTLLVMGMFISRTVNLFLIGPVLVPIMINNIGLSPIHTAMIIVFGLGVGLITPPVGSGLFATAYIGRMPIEEIVRFAVPYIIGLILLALLITYVPIVVEFLPRLMGLI